MGGSNHNLDLININKFPKFGEIISICSQDIHTGKSLRRFAGIYAYCRYFIDRKW